MRVPVERDGKTIMLNSYSLLQDRFYEHIKAAGFDGFERGERGSTREHLTDLEYKTMKEAERLAQKQQQSAAIDEANAKKVAESTGLTAKIQSQEATVADNEKRLAEQDKQIQSMNGKVLTVQQIEKIPVKISRPIIGGADNDTASMPNKDWESVKKTALTQAQTNDSYKTALAENTVLKKERKQWREDKAGLESQVTELTNRSKEKILERSKRDAELYNLKNDVAKIPKNVWDMYTSGNSQHRNNQRGEER
jgi:predicted  nucleic acid-binding Zn-ribbon protein